MRVLEKHNVKVTVMGSGLAAELWPESFRALHERGHEIASHGYDQAVHPPQFTSREEEETAIRKTLEAISSATGQRPVGHMSQGPRPTVHTPEVVAAEGLLWDGDYHDCDVPYVMDVKGHKVVSVGYVKPDFTDNEVLPHGFTGGLQQLKDAFDAVYEESADQPMKFSYAMHAHISSTPGAARMLDRFLDHAKSREGIWFCRCRDMAEFWLTNSR
jgi:chitin deacetylase